MDDLQNYGMISVNGKHDHFSYTILRNCILSLFNLSDRW